MKGLDELDLKVPQWAFEAAMNAVARKLGTQFDEGLISFPASIKDPSYPSAIQVLYRKLPCGSFGDYEGNCVTFDVIPRGIKGDPRHRKSYRSFYGTVEDSPQLFKEFLQWLNLIVSAVKRHQRL